MVIARFSFVLTAEVWARKVTSKLTTVGDDSFQYKMSNTLLIRHLSGNLEISERKDLLKYYGAQKVWFIKPQSHTAFASFASKDAADRALQKLHQLEVVGRRLTVEYAADKIITQSGITTVTEKLNPNIENAKKFINQLNATYSEVDFSQPPPPNLSYKYPNANPSILFNIMYTLSQNIAFYTQTLHLMNKMCLDPPFGIMTDAAKEYVQSSLCDIEISLPKKNINRGIDQNVSSEESEISNDDLNIPVNVPVLKKLKRNSNLKRINKKIKLQYLPPVISKTPDHKKISPNEIFEEIATPKTNKIEIKVNSTLDEMEPAKVVEATGTIGKMEIKKPETPPEDDDSVPETKHVISTKELLSNKIPSKDMKLLPVFKNYHPGTPSMRLYIKNLSKDVTAKDLEGIYERYLPCDDSQETNSFDVRVMQEGRMKGQAFITLPNIEASEKALNETNGFILKNKPMVVQFARTANK